MAIRAPGPPGSVLFWRAALRVAFRDLHFARRRALAVVLAVAAGAASITAVRGLSSELRIKLRSEAREWIASDVYVYLPQEPSPEELDSLTVLPGMGTTRTDVTELYTMAASARAADSVLAFFKVVDPNRYPFYGTIELKPKQRLSEALSGDSVVVSQDLLDKLNVGVGGRVWFGRAEFRVAAAIVAEPDWSAGISSMLPRVILSQEGFGRSGLALQGGVSHKLLFRLGPADLTVVRRVLEETFPYADVVDFRDPDPKAGAAFEHADRVLNLAAWMALAFGSLAMAAIMYLHAQSRLDTVAVMKALGARSAQVVLIYALQAAGLATAGGLLGAALALPLEQALVQLVQHFFPIPIAAHWDVPFAAQALAAGLLTALPSVAGPILALRRIRPLAVLRRNLKPTGQREPRRMRIPLELPIAVRLALRSLLWPGGHARTIVCALSAGIAMLTATFTCQRQVSERVAQSIPASGASFFIISAGAKQLDTAARWLNAQLGVEQPVEAFPLVWLRLVSTNGQPHTVASGLPGRWLATCSDSVREGDIALSNRDSGAMLRPDDQLEFVARNHTLRGRVTRTGPQYLDAVVSVLTFHCSAFQGLPVYYHAAVRFAPSQELRLRRELAARYPDLPTLSRAEFSVMVGHVASQAILMMQLLCALVLGIGVMLEMVLVSATLRLRQEEWAAMKSLGASPGLLLRVLAIEYGCLGLLAGLAGTLTGSLLATVLLSRILHQRIWAFDAAVTGIGILFAALLASAAGCLSSRAMLRRKPLHALRSP